MINAVTPRKIPLGVFNYSTDGSGSENFSIGLCYTVSDILYSTSAKRLP
jgi:hypothetical protein